MEKRHTVEELKSYAAQMNECRSKGIDAFEDAVIYYAIMTIGLRGIFELGAMSYSSDLPPDTTSIVATITAAGTYFGLSSSVKFLKAMKEKNKLEKKIDSINDELDALEEQEGNLAKVLR